MALPQGVKIGPGWEIGPGWTMGLAANPIVTAYGQSVGGSPDATGFFFAVLNRSIAGWDYFAANGNNGSWTVTGDFGAGVVTIPVVSVTNDANSVFPVVDQGLFQSGLYYTFQGR
jgi:hypothetical protein